MFSDAHYLILFHSYFSFSTIYLSSLFIHLLLSEICRLALAHCSTALSVSTHWPYLFADFFLQWITEIRFCRKHVFFNWNHFILQTSFSVGYCSLLQKHNPLKLSLLPETLPLYFHYFQFIQQLSLVQHDGFYHLL